MDLDKKFRKMYKHVELEDCLPKIQPSAMPFCPKKFIFEFTEYLSKGGQERSFQRDFYTKVGIQIHSVTQRWLARANPGLLFGNWKCYSCGAHRTLTLGPVKCSCGNIMDYNELLMKFPDAPIIGFCDGLLLDLEDDFIDMICVNGTYIDTAKFEKHVVKYYKKKKIPSWILELKSSGQWKVTNVQTPDLNYQLQATLYASVMKKLLPQYCISHIDVLGYILKFQARDKHDLCSQDFDKYVSSNKLYNITTKLVNNFMRLVIEDKPGVIFKKMFPCHKYETVYKECQYKSMCTDMDIKTFKEIFVSFRAKMLPYFYDKTAAVFI